MFDPSRPPPLPGQMSIMGISGGSGQPDPYGGMRRDSNPGLPGLQPQMVPPPGVPSGGQMLPRNEMMNLWQQYGPQGMPSPFGTTPGNGGGISLGGYPAGMGGDEPNGRNFDAQGYMNARRDWRADRPDWRGMTDRTAGQAAMADWRGQMPDRQSYMPPAPPQAAPTRPGIQPPASGGFFGRRGR